ncbi:MAG: hypothetical protein HUJ74_03210 [Lachnospiraceae bacterium]|nr:hypothetical protein [Lachnospiraceae bacterium]
MDGWSFSWIYLILGASLMTLLSTLKKLTVVMENLLKPLNKLHVPVHEISMMMLVAFRFIQIVSG